MRLICDDIKIETNPEGKLEVEIINHHESQGDIKVLLAALNYVARHGNDDEQLALITLNECAKIAQDAIDNYYKNSNKK